MHGTLRVNIGFCKLSLQLKYFETMLGVLGKTINNCNFCDRCLLYDFFFHVYSLFTSQPLSM